MFSENYKRAKELIDELYYLAANDPETKRKLEILHGIKFNIDPNDTVRKEKPDGESQKASDDELTEIAERLAI